MNVAKRQQFHIKKINKRVKTVIYVKLLLSLPPSFFKKQTQQDSIQSPFRWFPPQVRRIRQSYCNPLRVLHRA